LTQIVPLVDPTPARTPGVDPPELPRKEDLIAVINLAGSAFNVIATLSNEAPNGPVATAAASLVKINAQSASTTISDGLTALGAALTAANLMAPAMPLPQIPAKQPTPATPATVRPATTVPASRAATPTASGAPVPALR
jgi:hypothetical protein